MEKIYTKGCEELKKFFNEIGIGEYDNSKRHSLLGAGYGGFYLMGTTDSNYFVDENCLFQAKGIVPKDYKEVDVEYFTNYHRNRLAGNPSIEEISNYEIY